MPGLARPSAGQFIISTQCYAISLIQNECYPTTYPMRQASSFTKRIVQNIFVYEMNSMCEFHAYKNKMYIRKNRAKKVSQDLFKVHTFICRPRINPQLLMCPSEITSHIRIGNHLKSQELKLTKNHSNSNV